MKAFDFEFSKLGVNFRNKTIEGESKDLKKDDLEISFNEDLSIKIFTKSKTYIDEVYFDLKFENTNKLKMFRNGFQSWSPSYEIDFDTKFEKCLLPVLKNHYLDPENFTEKRSHFLTYLNFGNEYLLLIPQDNSFKVSFELFSENTLRIFFEIGKCVEGEFETPKITAKHTKSIALKNKPHKKIYGWTSWYYYYRNIEPDELIKNIEHIKNLPFKLDFFQIDDGYQESVGEWVENDKFKGRLKEIASRLNDLGITPGIWLAPYVCEKNSKIFKEHKDWLIKDKNGNPKPVGFNPTWSGYFYALDPMKIEVIDYLTEKITTLKELGFRMFKFDFLYSLMAKPYGEENFTRMERFNKGMETLRSAIGKESKLLGCGAPLIMEKGFYDYFRIGPDTKDGWEDTLTQLIRFEGRVSAKNSLRNTITRAFLNGKYFLNDPDVIFLKPHKLTEDERNTILTVNYFLSNFIFLSDPIYTLTEHDFDLLLELQKYEGFALETVSELEKDIFEFEGTCKDFRIKGFVNLKDKDFELENKEGEVIFGKGGNILSKHATQIYKIGQ